MPTLFTGFGFGYLSNIVDDVIIIREQFDQNLITKWRFTIMTIGIQHEL